MKPWWKSKTIWANVLFILSGALAAAQEFLPMLEGIVPEKYFKIAFFVVCVLNLVLRKVTTEGIGVKGK